MQEGSIVKMIENLHEKDVRHLKSKGITRWPAKGEDVYLVSSMVEMPAFVHFRIGIQLDEFPEISAIVTYFDARAFVELLPPGEVSISEIEKSAQPKVRELELELV